MGDNEGEKPAKAEKPSSPPREQTNVHVYPDWAAVQAYYGPGAVPPPYYNPAVTSGQAVHPYMWPPPQMMPPYGSPYAAMYQHGGMYGPSAAPVVATPLTVETPAKSSENDSSSRKKTKESDAPAASGNGNGNGNGNGESAANGSGHGQSQSTDCGTDGSYDKSEDSSGREDDNIRSCNGVTDSGTCHVQTNPYPGIDANSGNGMVPGIPLASPNPVGGMPTPEIHPSNGQTTLAAVNSAAPYAPRASGIGLKDEREIKREKRKQSNRESARRSRLRKQAEMEELAKKVDALTAENMTLRSEVNKLVDDSEKLRSENSVLTEKLKNVEGMSSEAVSEVIVDQERSHLSTENLLSKVDNPVSNGDHERGGEEK